MAYEHAHHNGEQGWSRPENGSREIHGRIVASGVIPEHFETLTQLNDGQTTPNMCPTRWNGRCPDSTNSTFYSHDSTQTSLHGELRPLGVGPLMQETTSSSTVPRRFPGPSDLPDPQYYSRVNQSLDGLDPSYQQSKFIHATGYTSPVAVRGIAPVAQAQCAQSVPFMEIGAQSQYLRSEPSTASQYPFSRNSSMVEPEFSSYGTPPDMMEYSVTCPYGCGTVLTGIHAVGNLTRHLKSRACPNSPRRNVDYPCPIHGCLNRYARSDGLKVHMRRRHGAPPPGPKVGSPMEGSVAEEQS